MDTEEFLLSNFVRFFVLENQMDDTIDQEQNELSLYVENLNLIMFFFMMGVVLLFPAVFLRIIMHVKAFEERVLTTISRIRQAECEEISKSLQTIGDILASQSSYWMRFDVIHAAFFTSKAAAANARSESQHDIQLSPDKKNKVKGKAVSSAVALDSSRIASGSTVPTMKHVSSMKKTASKSRRKDILLSSEFVMQRLSRLRQMAVVCFTCAVFFIYFGSINLSI